MLGSRPIRNPISRPGRSIHFGCGVGGIDFSCILSLLGVMRGQIDREVLEGVSRSFYLTLRLLPEGMRGPASLGYLLARTSDTLADSEKVSVINRLACLDQFEAALTGDAHPPRWPIAVLNGTANSRERHLLERTDEVFQWLRSTPEPEAELVRKTVTTIVSGQRLDLQRFAEGTSSEPVAMPDAASLEDYAWRVAGSVGAFWTELGFMNLGDRFSESSSETLMRQGIAYGKALQLVNILRDLPVDLKQGRCYLPVSNPRDHSQLLLEHARWLGRAQQWLDEGESYANSLHSRRLRAATVLPALLARKTLNLMRDATWRTLKRPQKISRPSVYWSMASALFR